tara:strand:+ start:1899 stop:2210 length:312 start_codon:yes stop_codon:yes gene_type:complete
MTRMREYIDIYHDTSGDGSSTPSWERKHKNLFANVKDTREIGSHRSRGPEVEETVTTVVEVRYRDTITAEMQIRHRGRTLHIVSTNDYDGKRRKLHLHCSRVQ